MKKRLLLILLFSFFIVNGAIAGSGSLAGDWEGDATAILPTEQLLRTSSLKVRLKTQ